MTSVEWKWAYINSSLGPGGFDGHKGLVHALPAHSPVCSPPLSAPVTLQHTPSCLPTSILQHGLTRQKLDLMGSHGVQGTPVAGHKRGREPEEQPIFGLLEQIRRLKLPCVDAATANKLLGPFVREALKFDERDTLLAIVAQFGWQEAQQGGPGAAGPSSSPPGGFDRALDLGSFSLLLQVCWLGGQQGQAGSTGARSSRKSG